MSAEKLIQRLKTGQRTTVNQRNMKIETSQPGASKQPKRGRRNKAGALASRYAARHDKVFAPQVSFLTTTDLQLI
jgi:hypothetical protein